MKKNNCMRVPFELLISVLPAAAVAVLVPALLSRSPLQTAAAFFTGVFSAPYFTGSFLNTMSLLLFASLGASVAVKSGCLNLGGSVQMYVAGCITAYLLRNPHCPFFAALLAAGAAGGIVALVSALLKIFRGVNEMLSSFLIAAAATPVLDYVVGGVLRDHTMNLLAMPAIAENHRIPSLLPPSQLNVSFFFAVALCLFVRFVYTATKSGKKFLICGTAPEFARYCGYVPGRSIAAGMFCSGALHGIAGFFAVTGTYYTCHAGFADGIGWNALSAALIARSEPLTLIASSLILSYIFTSCDYAVLTNNFSFDMGAVIQGIVLFTVSARIVIGKKDWKK